MSADFELRQSYVKLMRAVVALQQALAGLEPRLARVEQDVSGTKQDISNVKGVLQRLEPLIVRMDAQFSYLATKAELAEKPGRGYLWGVLAAPIAAYGCGLAALAILK